MMAARNMGNKGQLGVKMLEERHMISILVYLQMHGPSRKIDIYEGVSSNPRMPDKLNALETSGLIIQQMDMITRSTIVTLTERGSQVANMLISIDGCIKS